VPIDRELVKNEYVSDNVSFQFSVRGLMCAWTNVRMVVAPIRETTSQTMAALLLHLSPIFHNSEEGCRHHPIKSVVFSCWSQHSDQIECAFEDKGIISVHNVYRKRYSHVMQEDLGLSMTVWQVCHGGIHGLTLISKNITAREEGGSSIVLANGSDTTRPTTSMMQTAVGAHPPIFANSLRGSIKA
jgi:hypothetical protein